MVSLIVILVLALLPLWISLWGVHRSGRRCQAQLRRIRQVPVRHIASQPYYHVGAIIGDITCRYNARSPYLRCSVNPHGPCKNCRDYVEC